MDLSKTIEIVGFLDKPQRDALYDYVTDPKFHWQFSEDATTGLINTPQVSTPSFRHVIYDSADPNNHPHIEAFKVILANLEEKLNVKIDKLFKMQLDFLLNTKYVISSMPYRHNTPHRDYDQEHFVAVYCVNESDGETIVFNQTEPAEKYYAMHKSMPQKGKLLVFNGSHFYADSCPKVFTKRIVLTMHFTIEKDV